MDKRAVAVLFGGRSSEHSISSATAGGVLRAIDRDRFDVIPVGITRSGAYVLEDDDPEKFALDPSRMPEVVDNGTRIVNCGCGMPRASVRSGGSTSCCRSSTGDSGRTGRCRGSSSSSTSPTRAPEC